MTQTLPWHQSSHSHQVSSDESPHNYQLFYFIFQIPSQYFLLWKLVQKIYCHDENNLYRFMMISLLTRCINLFLQLFPLVSLLSSLVQVLLSQIWYLVLLLSCLLQVHLSHHQLLIHTLLIPQIVVSQPVCLTSYCLFHPLWVLLFHSLLRVLLFFLLSDHLQMLLTFPRFSVFFSFCYHNIFFCFCHLKLLHRFCCIKLFFWGGGCINLTGHWNGFLIQIW